ncbi:DedA family protein [Sinomonas sp. G460-2]|uniref:DedA family protein n=1 Tax=Sinomonas sp. G460-2 TaxID=3393464 RepID=UPI0039F089C2
MEFLDHAILHAAGQWWIYPILFVFFFVDGFAMIAPSETLIVALAAYWRHTGEPNLWILGATALLGAMAGDNMAYVFGRRIGTDRWRWMRRPRVQKVFSWARHELDKRGAVLIFTARYIPWGRVAVNYVAGSTRFRHRTFFWLDAFACLTWVGYSLGVGLLASSFPWLRHNPLLSVLVAVGFALVLGVILDHAITVFHRWRDAKEAEQAATRAAVAHRTHLSQHPDEAEPDDYAPRPHTSDESTGRSAGARRGPSLELDRD